jgi:uncharacterized membrane protein
LKKSEIWGRLSDPLVCFEGFHWNLKHSKSETDVMFEIPIPLHPAIVHFPIALIFLGAFLSTLTIFTRRGALPQFAAVTLILAAAAAQAAISTGGDQADAVLKRMPEAKPLILVHAEWGEWVRNVSVIAAVSAVLALGFYRVANIRRILAFITTLIAGAACYCVFEAAEHGAAMVYHHGVGVQVVPGRPSPAPAGTPPAESAASPGSSSESASAAADRG